MPNPVWPARTICTISLVGRALGQAVVNNHHFEATGAREALFVSDALRQSFAAQLAEDWRANLRVTFLAAHPQDYFLDVIRAQIVEVPGFFQKKLVAQDNVVGAPAPGTIAAPTDDMTTAVVIKWRTNIAGKSHRGRSYIGPLHEGQSALGVINAGQAVTYQAYLDAMIARYTGVGAGLGVDWKLTIYSRSYNQFKYQYTRRVGGLLTVISPPEYAGQSTNVESGVVDSTLRVQRRRELGRGA